jgi:hypothetical protein
MLTSVIERGDMEKLRIVLESVLTGKALLVLACSPFLFCFFLGSLVWVFVFEDEKI